MPISSQDRAQLEEWVKHEASTPRRLVFRSQICLLAAEGMTNSEIAKRLYTSRATVRLWKKRFLQGGPPALAQDAPRGPNPTRIDEVLRAKILGAVSSTDKSGIRWTTRSLAKALGVSNATISRVWRSRGLEASVAKPERAFSGRKFGKSGAEVVGLYVAPSVLVAIVRCNCQEVFALDLDTALGGAKSDSHAVSTAFDELKSGELPALDTMNTTEDIHYNSAERKDLLLRPWSFLDEFGQDSKSNFQYVILMFDPPSCVQCLVTKFVSSRPWLGVKVLPDMSENSGGAEKTIGEQLRGLNLSWHPRESVRFLRAIHGLIKQGCIDRDYVFLSNKCDTSESKKNSKTTSQTMKEFFELFNRLKETNGTKADFFYSIGGKRVNLKQIFESFFAAAAFAEVGEYQTARDLASTPVPELKESLGLMSAMSTTFAAAAFAEENCHDMATDLLDESSRRRSFLEEVGLVGVRVRYGLVSAEGSFAEVVGLSGVRYRMLAMQL